MNVASVVLSGLSLVAVLVIGWFTVGSGAKAAKASKESAESSARAADATEASALASKDAAKATERSVAASERAAALAAQDARARRLEAALDVVLEMQEIFIEQVSPATQGAYVNAARVDFERTALKRKLEGRLVPFTDELTSIPSAQILATDNPANWSLGRFESAIFELKGLLKATVQPR